MKLAALSNHQWRCTLDWKVMVVCIVCLLAWQKRLQDEYDDPDMLPKVNKANMAGMMKAIIEYLRSHHGVLRKPLAYVIRKTILVQTYGDYPKCATPECYDCQDATPTSKKEQAAQWEKCAVSQKMYSRIWDWQQKCLTYSTKSATTLICIHMSNSITPWGMAERHFTLSMVARPKPCEHASFKNWVSASDVDVCWWKEGMELEKKVVCHINYHVNIGI